MAQPSLMVRRINAAQRRSGARTREEFRALTGIPNGTFYSVLATGRVSSLRTLRRLEAAGVRVPPEAISAA